MRTTTLTPKAAAALATLLAAALLVAAARTAGADGATQCPALPRGSDPVNLNPADFSATIDNRQWPMTVGSRWVYRVTDMAVLAGSNNETCRGKYGSVPVRGRHVHEQALRIVLASIETHANRYKRTIRPVLSVSVDFYVRVFVTVHTSGAAVLQSPLQLANVLQCTGCSSFWLWPLAHRSGQQGDVIDLWAALHHLGLREAALDQLQTFDLEPAPARGTEKRHG